MSAKQVREALSKGEINIRGQFLDSSNATFLVACQYDALAFEAVYKPILGQSYLWDFEPASLPGRETAAYLLSQAAGWDFIPPTVLRTDSLPGGGGSLQLLIDHDPEQHYFNFPDEVRGQLRDIALFDLVVNNADRKAGHLLLDGRGKVWAIDNALCLHVEPKLRTVIWDFEGQEFSPSQVTHLKALLTELTPSGELESALLACITRQEIEATRRRLRELLAEPIYPHPDLDYRSFPWPLV